jgi:HipA-like protein
MVDDFQELKFVRAADVHKGGVLAGHLVRTGHGGVSFSYVAEYLTSGLSAVASSLPLRESPVETPAGALPPFFAGLLPEGHRLSVLRDATKTSLDDELTLLLAVGADVPGDVQVVPAGEIPVEPAPLADTSRPEELDFAALANAVDRHAIPGIQDKASASRLDIGGGSRGTVRKVQSPSRGYPQPVPPVCLCMADRERRPPCQESLDPRGPARRICHGPDPRHSVLYGDDSLALPVSGKTKNLRAKHWADFPAALGLLQRAATAANALALSASGKVRLEELPFTGSPLRGAERELRFRRGELEG